MRADESSNRVPSHKSVGLLADTSDGGTYLALRLERQYNLGVIFTEEPDGTFLPEVDVRLRRHDKVLAAIQATGPRCLVQTAARLPCGSHLQGTYAIRDHGGWLHGDGHTLVT